MVGRPNDDEATTHEVHEGGEGAVVNQPQGAVTKVVSGGSVVTKHFFVQPYG